MYLIHIYIYIYILFIKTQKNIFFLIFLIIYNASKKTIELSGKLAK